MVRNSSDLAIQEVQSLTQLRKSLADSVLRMPPAHFRGEIVGRVRKMGSKRWATLFDGDCAVEVEFPAAMCPSWLGDGHQLTVTARPNIDSWRRNPVWVAVGNYENHGQLAVQATRDKGPWALLRQETSREFGLPLESSQNLETIEPGGKISKVLVLCGRDNQVLLDFVRGLHPKGVKKRVAVEVAELRVQGPSAVREISRKLSSLKPGQADAVIILRGGGSYADFVAFDDRELIQAIRQCALPVITALGHSEHVPLAARAATASFDVSQTAGIAIRTENNRRWFAGQPTSKQLKTKIEQLARELSVQGSRTSSLEQANARLRQELADTRNHAVQLRERGDDLQQHASLQNREMHSDLLELALQKIRLNSLSRGLWWSLWTALTALAAHVDTGLGTGQTVALSMLPALWAIWTFTGGYRAQRIIDSSDWRGAVMDVDLCWLRPRIAGATVPRDLCWLLRHRNASLQQ